MRIHSGKLKKHLNHLRFSQSYFKNRFQISSGMQCCDLMIANKSHEDSTVDPFFLDRTGILELIEILIQFQVDELKKQRISTVLRARKRKNIRATAPFSKTSRFPMVFAWFSEGSRGRCGFSAHPDVVSLRTSLFDIAKM